MFLMFCILFYISMYISKTVHALWFDANDALPYFGVSYTTMAIAGALSFFSGRLSDYFSPRFALRTGVIVYSIGLILRIFTHSIIIAGLSGFIAGLGASLVIISMRHWILSIGSIEERPSIVAIKEFGTNTGIAVGTSVSGILVAALAYILNKPLLTVLIISSVICFLTLLLIPKLPKEEGDEEATNEKKIKIY